MCYVRAVSGAALPQETLSKVERLREEVLATKLQREGGVPPAVKLPDLPVATAQVTDVDSLGT